MSKKKEKTLYLDLNERTSPPPKVLEQVIIKQLGGINHYLRAEEYSRAQAIVARQHGVRPEEIVFFNGSWHCLMTIFSFLFSPTDEIIIPIPTFPFYLDFLKHKKFKVKKISGQKRDLTADQVIGNLGAKTKGLYLVNPTNPLGELISEGEIVKIIREASRREILVVLDEAYGNFAEVDSSRLVQSFPNLIVTKSGSKSLGLGGVRAGYLIANKKLADILSSARGPTYTVSSFALATLASPAIEDRSFAGYLEETKEVRHRLQELLKKNDITFYESQTNFVTFRVKDAHKFSNFLAEHNIAVKDLTDYPDGGKLTKDLVRLTLPPKKDWLRLKKVLDKALA